MNIKCPLCDTMNKPATTSCRQCGYEFEPNELVAFEEPPPEDDGEQKVTFVEPPPLPRKRSHYEIPEPEQPSRASAVRPRSFDERRAVKENDPDEKFRRTGCWISGCLFAVLGGLVLLGILYVFLRKYA